MQTEILAADHLSALQHALDVLNHSGLVAFPTDTVYGLAALPFDEESVRRLYVVKGRNTTKAIAVLLHDVSAIDQISPNLSPAARRLAETFWPGPLTLVVPRNPALPDSVSPLASVGVRVPNHPVALDLLRLAGPLAVTSANLSGQENTYTAQEVYEQLDGRIHLILDGGRTPGDAPSTVVDCTRSQPELLRPGPLSMEALMAVWETDTHGQE